jgi:endonuclease/exonuclease/phosphatase family metal-dependent hydrolase
MQQFAPWDSAPEAHPPASGQPSSPSLKVMSLNLAHGRKLAKQQLFVRGRHFHANLLDVAAVLRREAPHVVALQEADGPSFWSGDFHHVERLADLAGYDHHYWGRHNRARIGKRELASGTALLSKVPLEGASSHRFARTPPTPRKGFVIATLPLPDDGGRAVDIVSVHLDFLRKTVRRKQILAMEQRLAERQNPLIVLGDMNCWWRRRNDALPLLVQKLNVHPCRPEADELATFPSRRPRFRLDWILISPELEFTSYDIVADPVSDHLGVVAEVRMRPAA